MSPQIAAIRAAASAALVPPPVLSLAEWSEQNIILSPEDSAVRGRFEPWPFQREPMEVMSPSHPCERVALRWSSQVGKTRMTLNLLGYIIAVDPGPTLIVEPTQKDAKDLSVDRVAPMIRDTPVLWGKVAEAKSRDSANTMEHKKFQGGHVTFAFATSPSALASRPIRYLLLDEVSRYDASSGKEGDPVRLAERRTTTFWNRKIIYASSPGNDGSCRISDVYEYSDQREWAVPCPFCGHEQVLRWGGIRWSHDGAPIACCRKEGERFIEDAVVVDQEDARYQCSSCRCLIEHGQKDWMNEHGRWIAQNAECGKYPGFCITALNSPVRAWSDIVQEWIECQGKPEQLRVFVNTVLAETWKELGEEPPDDEKLWLRAQANFFPDPLPREVLFLTAGVDVQSDRLEVQIRGWGRGKQSWLVGYEVLSGKPSEPAVWAALDSLLVKMYKHEGGSNVPILRVAIDSGFAAQEVYAWARRQRPSFAIVTKGYDSGVGILGQPKGADLMSGGKTLRRGVKIWPMNVSMMKSELYGWMKHATPAEGQPFPPGYLHDYDAGREFFAQLCSERFQYRIVKGFRKGEWVKTRERNEALDTFGECRAAAEHIGISRFSERDWRAFERYLVTTPLPERPVVEQPKEIQVQSPPVEHIPSVQRSRRPVRGRFQL